MINTRHIQYIGRYVDDVLIVYDSALSTADEILHDHNDMHSNMIYKMEIQKNEHISFLDLNIHRSPYKIDLGIYRKPTFTDTVIPHSSNHPASHKAAAFHYMLDRANRLPLNEDEKLNEMAVINTIAINNGYAFHDITRAYKKQKRENISSTTTLSRIEQPQNSG
jgi:hypothetical protein